MLPLPIQHPDIFMEYITSCNEDVPQGDVTKAQPDWKDKHVWLGVYSLTYTHTHIAEFGGTSLSTQCVRGN